MFKFVFDIQLEYLTPVPQQNCLFDACMVPDNDDNVCQNAATYAQQCADAGHPVVGTY